MSKQEYETEVLRGMGELGKSRSQKKRESTAMQQMGEELAALATAALEALNLPGELLGAVMDLRGIKSHEARRRQNQLIGRLMRELEPDEAERIAQALRNFYKQHEAETASFHQAEEWRDALVDPDTREKTLAVIQAAHQAAEPKKIRHLAASAQAEREGGKSSKSYRELFKYLKGL